MEPSKTFLYFKRELSRLEKKFKKSTPHSPQPPQKILMFQRIELSSYKIKKLLIFQEMELSGSNIQKFLIFSQKKAFLIFQQTEIFNISGNGNPEKNPYISENGNPEKILYISETELSYISGGTSKTPKTKIYFISSKKVITFVTNEIFKILFTKKILLFY